MRKHMKGLSILLCAGILAMTGCGSAANTETTGQNGDSSPTLESEADQETESSEETTGSIEENSTEETDADDSASGIPVDAATWQTVQEYGFWQSEDSALNQYNFSNLAYLLQPETFEEQGDYYVVKATLSKPIEVPDQSSFSDGDKYSITINETAGITENLIFVAGTEDEPYMTGFALQDYPEDIIYFYGSQLENGNWTLFEGSDDTVMTDFAEGTLCISKEAVTGSPFQTDLSNQTLTDAYFSDDSNPFWFNGVSFDENGVVNALIIFGD